MTSVYFEIGYLIIDKRLFIGVVGMIIMGRRMVKFVQSIKKELKDF